MRFKTITRLLGVQTRQDSVDQQEGSLRQADGAVCWPNGALSFSLPWRSAFAIGNLPSTCATLLGALGHTTGTHAVIITAGASKILVFYSFAQGVRGLFPWTAPGADLDLSATASYASPADAWAHNLNANAQWFASPIGRALWIGNGVNANLYWDGTTLRTLLATVETGQYARAVVAFPACTSFIIGEQSVIYGSGNAAEPQKVWLTERPVSSSDYLEGIFSLTTSFVKLLHQRDTRIVGLSSWSSYVIAHTTNGCVTLFGFKQSAEGWICQQRNSAAGAGAVNHACARGLNGIGPFWLGGDGEIYKDESARTGPDDKIGIREFEIATRNAAEGWNRGLDVANTTRPPSLTYDQRQGSAWVFGYNSITQNGSLWAFNESLGQATGPYHAPNLARVIDCGPTKTLTILGLTTTGQLLAFRPSELDEPSSGLLTWPLPALSAPLIQETASPSAGTAFATVNTTTGAVALRVPNSPTTYETQAIGLESPLGDIKRITYAAGDAFFSGAGVSLIEFPLFDMGDVGKEKVLQQLILSWGAQSVGWVGVLAQNEKGHSSWRWLGSCYGKERQVAHPNLLGVRFRLRILVVSHPQARACLRDVVVGFLGRGVP
jgi:hypothetical protein